VTRSVSARPRTGSGGAGPVADPTELPAAVVSERDCSLRPVSRPGAPNPPYPPIELANRVGSLEGSEDPWRLYDGLGRRTREEIVRRLPPEWSFKDKRVLDFGCGAGRTLRHFLSEADEAEVFGCDIDDASIRWLQDELSPPFSVFNNDSEPPLPFADESLDLIWAISVFTHLTDSWAAWLLELHRVLRSDGLLFATFLGSGMSETIAGEPWREDRIGMNILKYGQDWSLGGPMVLHSPWWIKAHWGRPFEILSLEPHGFADHAHLGHGSVMMRKRRVALTLESLQEPEDGEPRETTAFAHGVDLLLNECAELRTSRDHLAFELRSARRESTVGPPTSIDGDQRAALRGALLEAEAELAETHNRIAELAANEAELKRWAMARGLVADERVQLHEQDLRRCEQDLRRAEQDRDDFRDRLLRAENTIDDVTGSVSWRLTAPLRRAMRLLRES
jgi:SAM-dependent methyltransferase